MKEGCASFHKSGNWQLPKFGKITHSETAFEMQLLISIYEIKLENPPNSKSQYLVDIEYFADALVNDR